jgi:exoribonuclease II
MEFSWKDAPDLMQRLIAAQNALVTPIDIVTFAGFCKNRDELEAHVVRYEQQVSEGL